MEQVTTHYLTGGDEAGFTPHNGEFDFEIAADKAQVSVDAAVAQETTSDVLYQDNYRFMATGMISEGAPSALGTSYEDDPRYQVTLSRTDQSKGFDSGDGKVSYIGIRLDLTTE